MGGLVVTHEIPVQGKCRSAQQTNTKHINKAEGRGDSTRAREIQVIDKE